jgi:hypothetical protein
MAEYVLYKDFFDNRARDTNLVPNRTSDYTRELGETNTDKEK